MSKHSRARTHRRSSVPKKFGKTRRYFPGKGIHVWVGKRVSKNGWLKESKFREWAQYARRKK